MFARDLQQALTRQAVAQLARQHARGGRVVDAGCRCRRADAHAAARVPAGRRERQLVVVGTEDTGQLLEVGARLAVARLRRVAEFGLRDQCTQLHLIRTVEYAHTDGLLT